MNLQQTKAEIKRLQEQARQLSQNLFTEGSKQIFQDFPELVSVSWQQYTPYFNDGDTCTFSAHTDYPQMVLEIDGEEIEDEEFSPTEWAKKYMDPKLLPFYDKMVVVHEWLTSFDDDFLLATFGDHARVTLTRDGVEVAEIYHD